MIDLLARAGNLCALGCSSTPSQVRPNLEFLAQHGSLTLALFESGSLEEVLSQWITDASLDVVFVAGFELKIPTSELNLPRHGFLNFHPGLLPRYRGPQPVFWQIRNGEPMGGISVIRMDAGWDTGDIVAMERIPIGPNETSGLHSYKLGLVAQACCQQILARLQSGEDLKGTPQDEAEAAYKKRPTPEELQIHWAKDSAETIRALVNAANPVMKGATFLCRGYQMRLLEASVVSVSGNAKVAPGTIVAASRGQGLVVQCAGPKQLRLDIVSSDMGVFSGTRMMEWFRLAMGQIL